MSCPVCGRMMCDHTPEERGQSIDEMISDYNADCESLKKKPEEHSPKKPTKKKGNTVYGLVP